MLINYGPKTTEALQRLKLQTLPKNKHGLNLAYKTAWSLAQTKTEKEAINNAKLYLNTFVQGSSLKKKLKKKCTCTLPAANGSVTPGFIVVDCNKCKNGVYKGRKCFYCNGSTIFTTKVCPRCKGKLVVS